MVTFHASLCYIESAVNLKTHRFEVCVASGSQKKFIDRAAYKQHLGVITPSY